MCSRLCTDSSQCGASEGCFQAQVENQIRKYCARQVALGDTCGAAELRQCSGNSGGQIIQCIDSGTDAGSRCMLRCEVAGDCPGGQDCSVAFGDGNGVCGAPTQPGDPCDQSQFVFCSAGQVCVVVSGTAGFCHTTCGTVGDTCANGGACISADPCSSSGQPFCVTPQPIDGTCNALNDEFCGTGADCVNLSAPDGGAVLLCKPDCTSGQSCATGTCRSTAYCQKMACF